MSYHIEINEYQRRLIMKALTSADVNQFSQAPGSGDAFDTEAPKNSSAWYRCLVRSTSTHPAIGLKLFSTSQIRIVSWWRPDCLAGVIGLELRNPCASHVIEIS